MYFKDRGIAPRVITTIFQMKKSLSERCKIAVKMSYVETKKMYLYDLLSKEENNVMGMNNMKTVTSVKVENEIEALKVLFNGRFFIF